MSEKKCLRCGADEFRINGYCSVYCEDMHEVEQENAALKRELAEHDEYYRKVMNEECAPDEVHCTCVPALRDGIAALKRELQDAKELIYRYENPDDVLAEEASHE